MHRLLALLLVCAATDAQPTRIDPLAEIAPVAGLEDADRFGRTVAIEGDWAVVGSARRHCDRPALGSTFVFRRIGARWEMDAELRDDRPGSSCRLGIIGIADGRIAASSGQSGDGPREVLLFERASGRWTVSDRIDLTPLGRLPEAVAVGGSRAFVRSLSFDGFIVLAGDEGTWAATDTLAVPGWERYNVLSVDGDHVAMQGTTRVDGEWRSELAVFEHGPTGWALATRATAPEDQNVRSVHVSGDDLVAVMQQGSGVLVRHYVRAPGGWNRTQDLTLTPAGTTIRWVREVTFDGTVLVAALTLTSSVGFRLDALVALDLNALDRPATARILPDDLDVDVTAFAVDQGRALVGDPYYREGWGPDTGGAFVFDLDHEVVAPDTLQVGGRPRRDARFGEALALGGARMAIVSQTEWPRGTPLLHVFRATAGGRAWIEEAAFPLACSSAPLALDGDRLVAGAETFFWDGEAWTRGRRLDAGCITALAIDGGRLAAGIPRAGQVEVYEAESDGWRRTGTLRGAPGSDGFGHAVGLDGGRLVVSSRTRRADGGFGTVDVFEAQGSDWVQTGTLAPPAVGVFGDALGLGGGWAVAGAPLYSGPTTAAEAVRIARGPFGTEVATLASPLPIRSLFGASLAVDGDRVLVGAPDANADGAEDVGAAFLFEHDGLRWSEAREVPRPALPAGSRFGSAVAVDGQRLVVGAPRDSRVASEAGTAFLYASSFATPSDRAPEAAATGLSHPSPNPAAGRAQLLLTPGAPGPARVTLHDALGRHVRTLLDRPLASPAEVEIQTAGLAAGVYIIRAAWDGGSATRTLAVVR